MWLDWFTLLKILLIIFFALGLNYVLMYALSTHILNLRLTHKLLMSGGLPSGQKRRTQEDETNYT